MLSSRCSCLQVLGVPIFIYAVSTEPVPELHLTTLKSRHRQMRMRTCGLREMKRVTSLGPTPFTQRIAVHVTNCTLNHSEYYKQHHQIKHTTSSTKEVRAREGWISCICLFCHSVRCHLSAGTKYWPAANGIIYGEFTIAPPTPCSVRALLVCSTLCNA